MGGRYPERSSVAGHQHLAQRCAPKAILVEYIDQWNLEFANTVRNNRMLETHIREFIRRDIVLENLEHLSLRLQRQNATFGTDEAREGECMRANIRRRHPRLYHLEI